MNLFGKLTIAWTAAGLTFMGCMAVTYGRATWNPEFLNKKNIGVAAFGAVGSAAALYCFYLSLKRTPIAGCFGLDTTAINVLCGTLLYTTSVLFATNTFKDKPTDKDFIISSCCALLSSIVAGGATLINL